MKPPFSTSASDNGMAARSDPYTPSAKRESDAGPLTDPGAPQGADWAKQHVVQRLRDAGIPPSMPLAAALAKHSALDEVRQEMIRSAGSETAMVELFGDMLGTFGRGRSGTSVFPNHGLRTSPGCYWRNR